MFGYLEHVTILIDIVARFFASDEKAQSKRTLPDKTQALCAIHTLKEKYYKQQEITKSKFVKIELVIGKCDGASPDASFS